MGTGVHLVDRSQGHITEALRTLLTVVRTTHAIQTNETDLPTGVVRFKDNHILGKIGPLKCTEVHQEVCIQPDQRTEVRCTMAVGSVSE